MSDYHPDFDSALQKGKEGQITGPWSVLLVRLKHPEGRGGMSEVGVVCVVTSTELYLATGVSDGDIAEIFICWEELASMFTPLKG